MWKMRVRPESWWAYSGSHYSASLLLLSLTSQLRVTVSCVVRTQAARRNGEDTLLTSPHTARTTFALNLELNQYSSILFLGPLCISLFQVQPHTHAQGVSFCPRRRRRMKIAGKRVQSPAPPKPSHAALLIILAYLPC